MPPSGLTQIVDQVLHIQLRQGICRSTDHLGDHLPNGYNGKIRQGHDGIKKAKATIMSATLETRVEALEHEVSGMKAMLGGQQRVKDWRATFGMSRNDPDFDELVRLGREIRDQQSEGGTGGVGS
jgi:hypothetical protein